MLLTIALFTCILCLIAIYAWLINKSYDYFKRHGIPGPSFRFFFGHYRDLWAAESFSRRLESWTKKYGSIYGLFLGTTPMYVVSDADFLQEVYIKQFSAFQSRHLPILLRLQTGNKINVFRATGARWRRQRHVLNPTFSAGKLKLMSPLLDGCVEEMLKKLAEMTAEKQTDINIYDLYKRMTMDVICRCAFGIDTDVQNDTNHIYLRKSAGIFELDIDKLSIVKLTNLFPCFENPLRYIYLGQVAVRRALIQLFPVLGDYIEETPISWLINRLRDVVDFRHSTMPETGKRMDLLQLMIDASTRDEVQDYLDEQSVAKVLHSDEVISNVFLFMVAGYETTSTALAYSTYVLATKPDIQEKLFQEIGQYNWNQMSREEIYDSATTLSYLDMFLREVLRMYPVTTKGMSRECNTTTIVCGHRVEKGSVIQPDLFSVHYNADLWGPVDPKIFYPERHAVKRHPAAWMPFGIGPRHCVGIRFALMELKMCLIRLLNQYRIVAGDKIEQGFQCQERLVIQPGAIYIKLESRSP